MFESTSTILNPIRPTMRLVLWFVEFLLKKKEREKEKERQKEKNRKGIKEILILKIKENLHAPR